MDDYQDFLKAKRPVAPHVGFDVGEDELNPQLFTWQRHVVRWALRRGVSALFEECGLGKTAQQLVWAEEVCWHTEKPVLILTPLAVAPQTVREAAKFSVGMPVVACESQIDVPKVGIAVTNYHKLHHFDPAAFAGVVLDECFAPGTLVDVARGGYGCPISVAIETLRPGDRILNAAGIDRISDVHRREVPYAVKVTIDSLSFIASPNHPILTQRGWVGAQHLRAGDYALDTASAVRLVRPRVPAEVPGSVRTAVLRDVLLSEMADGPAGHRRKSPFAGSCCEAGQEEGGLVEVWRSEGGRRTGKDSRSEPNVRPGGTQESLPPVERDRPQTFRAWGQWDGFDESAANSLGCTWRRLGCGICFVTGPASGGLPDALQARLGQPGGEGVRRSGWKLPPLSEVGRLEEDGKTLFVRVDSAEVLEPGHPELERLRDADGKLYFYDLGGTRHPSYSVAGCLVHNSSILKSFTGKIKGQLCRAFAGTPYRLCCTATPSPNDVTELGNHAEFLGVMTNKEMLARWFINDLGDVGTWRLKGHAAADFWRWVASWAACVSRPSDLGFPDDGYELPPLNTVQHVVTSAADLPGDGELFASAKLTASTLYRELRSSTAARAAKAAELMAAADPAEPWVLWCNTNDESAALVRAVPGAVEVKGSDPDHIKESRLAGFATGRHRVLVSKASLCGFGLNWQHCSKVAFVGLSYSFEQMYQAIRRSWRFGQSRPVDCHIITADGEGDIVATVSRKQEDHRKMVKEMVNATRENALGGVGGRGMTTPAYEHATGDGWDLHLGDCCEVVKAVVPDESVGLSVFSPPFASLFVYSDAEADMGNCASQDEFFRHFGFLVPELYRVTKPGRCCVVHCKDLPRFKWQDGHAGLKDFSGDTVKLFESCGWSYQSRVTIWKDPVREMQRTKAHHLLYKNLLKDSSGSHPCQPDYLLLFRKPAGPGDTTEPVSHKAVLSHAQTAIVRARSNGLSWGDIAEEIGEDVATVEGVYESSLKEIQRADREYFPLDQWQAWASPVWMDIDQSDTLNYRQAREGPDERHICPLQLGVIRRAVRLWSNPGDVVLSPFAGIGSEGYVSVEEGRRFVGVELKDSYFRSACRNLASAVEKSRRPDLYAGVGEPAA